jgi:hypothetical protein
MCESLDIKKDSVLAAPKQHVLTEKIDGRNMEPLLARNDKGFKPP